MRIALVTPYSWTYEGGVNRHTQALAEHLIARGNDVRVLAPWDPPDRLSRTLHRGAAPRVRPVPEYLTPLGRTVGFDANGDSLCNVGDIVAANLEIFSSGNTSICAAQPIPGP